MQTILLIRHAKAGDRQEWDGPDDQRPLTKAGRAQAREIADRLAQEGIVEIRSSPAQRCMQTVEPLAKRMGREVIADQGLMENCSIDLPDPAASGIYVLCAHGDNIPALLASLKVDCGACRKGSIWRLQRDAAGRIVQAQYTETGVE